MQNEAVLLNGSDKGGASFEFDDGSASSDTTDANDDEFVVPNSTDESDETCCDTFSEFNEPHTSSRKQKKGKAKRSEKTVKGVKDDGEEANYMERIREHRSLQELAKLKGDPFDDPNDFQTLSNDCRISNSVWNRLYRYQKTGVRWLYELHFQYVGGILADEMGLGKTIQLCVFLRSLSESQTISNIFRYKGFGPSLIVCPATLLHQWVKELNAWFPLCKVAVLHSSGAFSGPKATLIRRIGEHRGNGSILVTSYSTFMLSYEQISAVNWHYFILDEGHKIRNPEAKITLALKELRTPHRLILSGSPMQNNFRELWSLIDFIYPGRLGSLKEFMEKFSVPITQGGYANASAVQVRTAFKTACVLRDAISPYLLRRMKKDVQMVLQLPDKSEQILFCDITSEQRQLYLQYIESKACDDIVTGKQMPFAGLMFLRKLCNHPDLVSGGPNRFADFNVEDRPDMEFGFYQRSGKMVVLRVLLRLWREQNHKVLLFSQSRQMLSIIESFVITEGYSFLRMDGTTPIGSRQTLVEQFNKDPDIFVFLLTTKVGGLGINLTGANRVLIFDPDWNPSTDAQARERSWRIGQHRAVTIYRLLTSGTIEEKIYQRQIFKQFLANRVLDNPKQQRFFKTNELHELFTLGSSKSDRKYGTETAVIFAANGSEVSRKKLKKNMDKRRDEREAEDKAKAAERTGDGGKMPSADFGDRALSDEARERLKMVAKRLAANFGKTETDKAENGRRKRDKVLFEGKYKVPLLRKQVEVMQKKEEDNDETAPEGHSLSNKEQDDYVLRKLLSKKVGVHSALQHDQIIKESSAADIQLIEDEANAVAKRAADVLKRSRRRHLEFLANASEFGPIQTKKSLFGRKRAAGFIISNGIEKADGNGGGDGASKERTEKDDEEEEGCSKPFDGSEMLGRKKRGKCDASGAELLKSIRQRKERQLDIDGEGELAEGEEDESNYPSISAQLRPHSLPFGDKYEKLADEIRNFLAVNDGRATTSEILSRFKNRVHPSESFVFRSILKHLCKFLPNSQWVLRDEFV
ncbi:hypothetical protein niasHT_015574 [Heterodera trifolii]|uniref:DNA repair and recombination protein RAD54-like n=1 Tax=Heterodera trifolii TaxID=157864 RepID=A0ABD2LCA8_9BILA